MEDSSGIVAALIGWLPLIIIMLVFGVWMRATARRQGSMTEVGRENTRAVEENTEAVKALVEELKRGRQP